MKKKKKREFFYITVKVILKNKSYWGKNSGRKSILKLIFVADYKCYM